MSVSHITTHVLDTVTGLPASGVTVQLFAVGHDEPRLLAESATDDDGRAEQLGPEQLPIGIYRLRFDTGAYFAARDIPAFFPEAVLTFTVDDVQRHYHVPLLLSPFAYSTYRGS